MFGSADMPAAALYAPIDFIKKNPNTVQALTNAMVRALLWLQKATPDQVVATVPPEYLLGNKAVYLASYNKVKDAFSPDGRFNQAGAENTLKYLAAFNPAVKPAAINLAQTFDNSYVREGAGEVQEVSGVHPPRAPLASRRSRSIASPARSPRASEPGERYTAVKDTTLRGRRRRVRLGRRPDRLRQVDAAQRRRRTCSRRRRATSACSASRSPASTGTPATCSRPTR